MSLFLFQTQYHHTSAKPVCSQAHHCKWQQSPLARYYILQLMSLWTFKWWHKIGDIFEVKLLGYPPIVLTYMLYYLTAFLSAVGLEPWQKRCEQHNFIAFKRSLVAIHLHFPPPHLLASECEYFSLSFPVATCVPVPVWYQSLFLSLTQKNNIIVCLLKDRI